MKIKKRSLKFILAFFVILILFFAFMVYSNSKNKNIYSFKEDKFSYSENRVTPEHKIELLSHNESFDLYKIRYISRKFLDEDITIYGFLLIPKNKSNFPGVVLLPGGGVTKEAELYLASKITELGYAVLTIDQRGIGETGGIYLGFEQDYQFFSQGLEPMQHMAVYDALAAYDVLKQTKGIDQNNIAIAGESMGGRYAIIAAAIEPRLKGVIGISASGFGVDKKGKEPFIPYLLSNDPDNYIDRISPRIMFMIHGTNDTTVPIENAKKTFNLAKEPKKFYSIEGCKHGYCDKMNASLKESLAEMLK